MRRAEEHWCLILASDGLWDVFTNAEAIDFVIARMLQGDPDFGAQATVCVCGGGGVREVGCKGGHGGGGFVLGGVAWVGG